MRIRTLLDAAWTAGLVLVVAVLATLAAVHALADDRHFLLALVHAGVGWSLLPAAPVAALALVTGRRKIAVSATFVAVLHLAWVAPGHLACASARPADAVGVGSANLLAVAPRPDRQLRALLELDVDVWCLQELTGRTADLLTRGDPARRWPHRHLEPDDDSAFGIGIASGLPLADAWTEDLVGVPVAFAVLGGVGPAAGTTLVCVHTVPPRNTSHTGRWSSQMDALTRRVAALSGPVVVAGDLNATRHHPAYRRLLAAAGLRDAHAEVGRASAWTWPAPPYWDLLPKLRLDHVLVSEGVTVWAAEEGRAAGSDHRPIAVTATFGPPRAAADTSSSSPDAGPPRSRRGSRGGAAAGVSDVSAQSPGPKGGGVP
jgi:endonuclease/exonuclease/phosphatase (EEP) superfamily protein YafD